MKEKIYSFALVSVGILAGGIILLISVKYVLPVLLPFIIAWIVAAVTASPAKKLSGQIKVPERVLRLMMSLFLTLAVASAVILIIWQATAALWRFLTDIGEGNRIYDLLTGLLSKDAPILGNLLPEELAGRISEAIGSMLSSFLSALASGITSLAGAIPQAFLFLLVSVISMVYFALDYDRISRFVRNVLPNSWALKMSKLKDKTFSVIKKYILSYSLILLITFGIMLLGFMLLRVEHAFLIAMLVAFLDILPVIGVGTVLIPWSIFELATGNKFLGIGLIMLFVVNAIIRQLSEPRIVGKNLNLHPIVTLIMIYVGYALFGVAGLILLPVLAVSISALLKSDNSAEVG